jgi:predicted transcriptional regulator
MATTVHLPPDLLEALDRRARELQISRNRLITRTLRAGLEERDSWSPAFIEAITDVSAADQRKVDEMLRAIDAGRSSKGPLEL